MAADSDPNIRQRKPEKATEHASSTEDQPVGTPLASKAKKTKDTVEESRWLDVARTLTLLLAISCSLSYLVSSGDSFFWSLKVPPKYMRAEWWKSQLVSTCNHKSHAK